MAVYTTESFDTKDAADARAMHLKQSWHGYDPVVKVYKDSNEFWVVDMNRRHSCD